MSQALYRKYRSRSLDEIVGQDHITSLLSRAIAAGAVSHAYLLTGPRGVGKTSIARIIAHEINGLEYSDESQHLDIIEIDAASNNGVEDVRDLREKVHVAPSSAAKKIYIIDEVHMLSKAAFNALLKTLEEPPEHVVFILATTDVEKLPATIISRVQRFNFRAVPIRDVASHLRMIADRENIAVADDALMLIARHGQGSFRDSISLLDQLRHSTDGVDISIADVQHAIGTTDQSSLDSLLQAYRNGDLQQLTESIKSLEDSGAHAGIITQQIVTELHDSITDHPEDLPVIDQLLAVSKSPYPFIKLLTTLAARVAQPEITLSTTRPTKTTTTHKKSPPTSTPTKPKQPPEQAQPHEVETQSKTQTTSHSPAPAELDWNKLLEATNSEVALKALLAKCGHRYEDGTLTIYVGSKFNAERLKSSKQQPKLHAALKQLNAEGVTLHISPDKAPPSDSQAAAVAAIMGGGEEVEYDG